MPSIPPRWMACRRRPPPRRRSFEVLEPRTLLSSLVPMPAFDTPFPTGTEAISGLVTPGSPLIYQVSPGIAGLLSAQVHSEDATARLSLLDGQGHVLLQSDGQSQASPDPVIDLHVAPGNFYLEVESLGGSGTSVLTATLTATTDPFATLPTLAAPLDTAPLAVGDFNGDGIPDFVDSDGVHLGTGDGAFQIPPASAALAPGSELSAIVAGHFASDGHLDIAYADQTTGAISVALGNGDGTFQKAVVVATLRDPSALATADLLNNGHTDLIIADAQAGTVTVVLGNGDGTFQKPLAPIAVGAGPDALVVADFNHDGTPDLAVAGYGSDDVRVLLGKGDGTFLPAPAIVTGLGGPTALALGDFNHDGTPDLAVADFNSNDVTILQGLGDGTFQVGSLTRLAQSPRTLAAGDFNGDGRTDLVVGDSNTNPGSGTVSLLLENGDGTFGSPVPLNSGSKPGVIAAVDLTGDGRLDLVVSHVYSREVSILLNDGAGGFVPSSPPALTPMATGDFNGDGIADYVAADGVHLGAGDGTFLSSPIPLPLAPDGVASAIVVADFNGDGHPDLAVADYLHDDVTILLGDGDGTFRVATVISVGQQPDAIAVGDFNRDGHADLAVANDFSGNVTILLGNGDGTFRNAGSIAVGLRPDAIVAGDFRGDGRTDLAVADAASGTVTVLLGNGNGTFLPGGRYEAGPSPSALVAADFYGDGRTDLAVADTGGLLGTGGVVILPGNGDGTFRPAQPVSLGKLCNPDALVVGDLNGDGRPDLVIADAMSEDVTVILNDGQGEFHAGVSLGQAQSPYGVLVADFNGDGRPDLLVSDRYSRDVSVSLGQGGGRFQNQSTNPIGLQPEGLTTADFNGDGRPDLAVPDQYSNDVTILLGNGDGTFQTADTIAVGQQPDAIMAGDFNGDGRMDLVVANFASNNVKILLGLGDGTFLNDGTYATGSGPDAVAVGDFNEDGKLDIAVSNYYSNDITILLGNGDGTFRYGPSINAGVGPTSLAVANFFGHGQDDLAIGYYGDGASDSTSDVVVLPSLGDGSFGTGTVIQTPGCNVENVTSGDLNGHADLAVAADPGVVLILLNDGHGHFQLSQTVDIPPNPVFVYTGDFNGDGVDDLAVIDFDSGLLTIIPGLGDGKFGAATTDDLSRYGLISALVTVDVNGDGLDDLSMAMTNPGDVLVRLSLGGFNFADPVSVTQTQQNVSQQENLPVVADLNGDHVADMVVVDAQGEILVRFGRMDGSGTYDPPVVANPGFPSRDVTVVNIDSGPLLVSVDTNDDALSLFEYGPDGFRRVWSLPTGPLPEQVVAADLSGDGQDDLVVRCANSNALTVYFNDAYTGSAQGPFAIPPFGARFLVPSIVPVGMGISDVAVADLEGNGRGDIVVTDKPTGTVEVLRNLDGRSFANPVILKAGGGLYGAGTSLDQSALATLESTAGVAAGVFAAGGPPGLVAVDPGSSTLTLLSGLGGGRFANPVVLPTKEPARMVRVADFNGDGLDDLAVLETAGVEIFLNNGYGGFLAPTFLVAGITPTGLTVADVNQDGRLDLVVGNPFGDILVLRGNGDGTFQPVNPVDTQVALAVASRSAGGAETVALAEPGENRVVTLQDGTSTVVADAASGLLAPGAVQLADLNGDGIPDLIVANSGGNNVMVYPGLPNGTFGPALNDGHGFFVGTDPVSITVANLEGDGRPDLVVANKGSNDVSILLNRSVGGVITLVAGPRLSAGYGPTATAVADVNGDGIPDLLVSDSLSNDLRVLPGLGNGFFSDQDPIIYATGQDPGPVFVGNFTRPGELDAVTLNAGSKDLTLIQNVGHDGVVPQSIPSGGMPVAGVPLTRDDGKAVLLVANSDDGILDVFLAGPGGLDLTEVLDEPGHPSALATDGSGNIFAGFEGSDTVLLVALGLGVTGAPGTVEVGTSLLPNGPADEQVVLLLPLPETSALTVATLLSVNTGDLASPGVLAAPVVNQPFGQGPAATSGAPDVEGETDVMGPADEADSPKPGTNSQRADPFVQFIAGLDEAFQRAHREVKLESSPTATLAPLTSNRAVVTHDARHEGGLSTLPTPGSPASNFWHGEPDTSSTIDKALEALDATKTDANDPGPDGLHTDARMSPPAASATPVVATALAMLAVSLALADVFPTRALFPLQRWRQGRNS